jgi:hypothetical protein
MAEENAPHGEQEQDTTDWKAKYEEALEHSRKWEGRAKENKARADALEAGQTDAEKLANDLATLREELGAAKRSALVSRVQATHGISDEDAALFLTGTDEDTLTKQAARLAERTVDHKKQGNVAPKEGDSKTSGADDTEMREFARNLFDSAD